MIGADDADDRLLRFLERRVAREERRGVAVGADPEENEVEALRKLQAEHSESAKRKAATKRTAKAREERGMAVSSRGTST